MERLLIPSKKIHADAILPVYGSEEAAGADFYTIEDGIILPDSVIGVRSEVTPIEYSGLAEEMYKRSGITVYSKQTLEEEVIFNLKCPPNDLRASNWFIQRNPVVFRTGLAVSLPDGVELQFRGRSGLGFNYEIVPFYGTVDSDFTGELKIKVWNNGIYPFEVEKGMRIAQGVLSKVLRGLFVEVDELEKVTVRGEKGFNSTGLK